MDSGQLEAEFWLQTTFLPGLALQPPLATLLADLPRQWLDAQLHEWAPPCVQNAFPCVLKDTSPQKPCTPPSPRGGSLLESLPAELLQQVALHLPRVQDLAALCGSCSTLRRAVREEPSERFWAALFLRHFAPLVAGVPVDAEWRGTYWACWEALCGGAWQQWDGLRVWRVVSAIVCALDDVCTTVDS